MARKQKKYHFIYKTTNILSGKYYIGMHSTDDLEDGYLGRGLRYSINKYGKDNFTREILEYCNTREELKKREAEIVSLNEIAKEDCINLVVGGDGWSIKANNIHLEKLMNDEVYAINFRNKVSEGLKKLYQNGRKGKNYFNWSGKTMSEETKLKMSESSKGMGIGKANSQYGTCWITKDDKNKKINKVDLPTYEKEGWCRGRFKNSKIDKDIILELKKHRENDISYGKLSKMFNIPKSTIIDIVKRK